jgi:hypothetical protein
MHLEHQAGHLGHQPFHPELAFHLTLFLANDRPLASWGTAKSLVMICPVFTRTSKYVSRAITRNDPDQNRRMYRPRKYVGGWEMWTCQSPKLGNIQSPSANGAFADLDRRFPGKGDRASGIGGTTQPQLPDDPSHGSTRNCGSFDGHVSAVTAGGLNDEAHYNGTIADKTSPCDRLTSTRRTGRAVPILARRLHRRTVQLRWPGPDLMHVY